MGGGGVGLVVPRKAQWLVGQADATFQRATQPGGLSYTFPPAYLPQPNCGENEQSPQGGGESPSGAIVSASSCTTWNTLYHSPPADA